jgi:hypothetical protein
MHIGQPTTRTPPGYGRQAQAVVFDNDVDGSLRVAEHDLDVRSVCMTDGVVNCLLDDAIDGDHSVGGKLIEASAAVIDEHIGHGSRRFADAALEQCLDRLAKTKELQDRGPGVVNDHAQLADAVLDILLYRFNLRSLERGPFDDALHHSRDARQVGERLVVEVHAERLPGILQFFGQLQGAGAQSFRARFCFHLAELTLSRQLPLLQSEEVRGQDIGDDQGMAHI